MDWDDLFPVFAIAAVASFVLSLKSFFDVRALRAQLAGLTDKLPMYDHWLLRLAERIDGLATAPPPAEPAPPTVEEAPLTPAPEPVREQPVEPAPVAASTTEDFPPTPAAAPPQWDWERLLVENWLVWLGGTVLCAAGIGSGGLGDRVREPLRGASALRLTALRPRLPAASPDRRGDGRAIIADGPLCRGARSGRRLCRAAANRERRAACLAAVRLSRGDNGGFAGGVAAPGLVVAGLAVAGRRDAVGAAVARQRRRPRDAGRGAVPAGANRLVYGVSPGRPASRVSRRHCRHPDGAGGHARGDVGGRDRAVFPGECRRVRRDQRRRGVCRGDRVSGPGLSRRWGRRRDPARRRPRHDAARKLEPAACHPGDEPVGLPAAARPYRRLHDYSRAVCRAARRRPVSAVSACGAAGAMGGAVRRDPAAGIGHRLLATAEIRCRYRLDLDRAGAGRDRTRRRLLGRAAAQRATRNAARPRDRNRPRRLCGRRARQHDRRRHPGARRGLADRCLGIAPAGARLDRRPLPLAGVALAGARRRRCGAGPAGAQPLCAELRTRADADLQLVALRLWRAGGLVHRRHAPVRQPQGRCADRGTRSRQLTVFAIAAELRIDARDLWPADARPGRRFRL